MCKNVSEKIQNYAINILQENVDGLSYSDLFRNILELDGDLNINTLNTKICGLETDFPDVFEKPLRGVYRLKEAINPFSSDLGEEDNQSQLKKISEEEFYKPFANWLQHDIEEATHAIPLGKNKFCDKYSTPDVIGISMSMPSDIIQSPVEIVSAEIKTDLNQVMLGSGQACAYKVFSHKSYLVVPEQISKVGLAKLCAVCLANGLGLVIFDVHNHITPNFRIRVTPIKNQPDLYYTNKNIKKIERELFIL